jgi:hypothetical protein
VARRPPADRPTVHDEPLQVDPRGFVRDADHHDPTVDAETADDRFDGGRRRRGDEDDARAAEALQRLGRVLGPGVDGVVRTELGSQLALVGAPGERDGLEPRRTCVLDA